MPPKIRILSENLCNQIAAGEVVERPLSVVKELVENSLDAGAAEIRVLIEKGGKSLIRVEDDGVGMGREDLFLSLERHATSKIATAEDLFRLTSLGFRGEALPSIAAVSRMRLASRTADGEEGFEILVAGGKVTKASAAGVPAGTVMEVRNLFFNTPARKKFLKTETTEFGHIADFISKIALSFPQVQISLEHNQRPVINLFRHSTLADRVVGLMGTDVFRQLVSFENTSAEGLKVHGFVGLPDLQRKSPAAIHSFVNRRFVRDRLFQHAVMEGYRNLLPRHCFPVVILFLEIAPDLVDVNVHPAKREVRFRQQGLVHDFLASSIQNALRRHRPQSEVPSSTPEPRSYTLDNVPDSNVNRGPQGPGSLTKSKDIPNKVAEEQMPFISPPQSEMSRLLSSRPKERGEVFSFHSDYKEGTTPGFFSSLEILGQFHNSYIVCRSLDELVIIDQHAAHERIGFERLKIEFDKGQVEAQELLFPKTMEFGFKEAAALEENLDMLPDFGFSMEPFSGKTFVLRSIPAILNPECAERVLKDLIEELVGLGQSRIMTEAVDKLLITMACHSMVRANQPLSSPEMRSLLKEMDAVDFNTHCPHGRPAVARFTLRDVEKMFHRP